MALVSRPASTIQPDDLRRPRARAGAYGVASVWILHGVEALYLFVYPSFCRSRHFACERPVCADFSFHFTSRGFDGRVAAAAGTLRALREQRNGWERGRSLRVWRDRCRVWRWYDDICVAARGWFEVDGSAGRSGKRCSKRRRALGGVALTPRCRAIKAEEVSADLRLR